MPANIFSLAQIVGYAAYVLTIVAFWQKRDKKMLLLNAVSAATWVVHYGLLGAWAGSITEILVTVRSILSAYMTDKRHKHLAAGFFLIGFVIVGVFTYHYFYDVFVVAACMLGTVSMVYWDGIKMRWGMLVTLILWLLYTLFAGSIGGVMSSVTIVTTQIITLLRMYRDKKLAEVAAA